MIECIVHKAGPFNQYKRCGWCAYADMSRENAVVQQQLTTKNALLASIDELMKEHGLYQPNQLLSAPHPLRQQLTH